MRQQIAGERAALAVLRGRVAGQRVQQHAGARRPLEIAASARAARRACRRARRPCRPSPCPDCRDRRHASGSSARGVRDERVRPFQYGDARGSAPRARAPPPSRSRCTDSTVAPPSSRAASPGCGVSSQSPRSTRLGGKQIERRRRRRRAADPCATSCRHSAVRPGRSGRARARRRRRRPCSRRSSRSAAELTEWQMISGRPASTLATLSRCVAT